MKPIPKPLVWALRVMIALPLVGMLGWSQWKDYKRSRVISCTNHGHQTALTLKRREHEGVDWVIPHLADTEGHKVFVAYTVAEHGPIGGGLNCHHGAPRLGRGGWQCVNLPKTRWLELLDHWEKTGFAERYELDGIPIYWCGRATGTGDRVCGTVRLFNGKRWLDFGRIKEEKLAERVAWLNRQLAELGERPVALDIPPDVDWPAVIKWAESVTNSFPKPRP